MKNLKVFIYLLLIASLSASDLIAQPANKVFREQTYPYTGLAFCGTEMVIGTVTYQWKVTVVGQWFQLKIFYSLVGQESGCHYEAQAVINLHYKIPPSGVEFENFTRHFFVKKDNVPVGYIHENLHFTVNPNGDITVNNDNLSVECFESH